MSSERRLFAVLFTLAISANAAVILRTHYWPCGDLGGHMELMDVMMRYDDAHTAYRATYVLPSHVGPNGLLLFVARALRGVTDTPGVTRFMLVFYVSGLPLAILALCRAYGRSRWLSFLAVPMVFSSLYNHGFLNYLVALPLVFFGIALARTFAERGGVARGVALALLLPLLLFAHVIAFFMGISIVLFVLALHVPRLRDSRRFLVTLPAFVPVVPWAMRMFAPASPETRSFSTSSGDLGLVWTPREDLLANIHHFGLRIVRDDVDEYLVLAIGVLLAIAIGSYPHGVPSRAPRDPGVLAFLRAHSLECVTLICAVTFFVLPSHMNEFEILTERIILLVMLLGVAWPRLEFETWGSRALIVPFVALAFAYAWAMDVRHRAFEQQYFRTLPRAIAALPDGSTLGYAWIDLPDNDVFHVGPLWHLPRAIHAVENGGITDDSFAARHYTPIQYRPGKRPPPIRHGAFWASAALDAYDAILVHARQAPSAALTSPRLRLRHHDGVFWLFDVVAPAAATVLR